MHNVFFSFHSVCCLTSRSSFVGNEPSNVEVDHLLQDIEKFTLASHLVWGLWGIISVSFFVISLNLHTGSSIAVKAMKSIPDINLKIIIFQYRMNDIII